MEENLRRLALQLAQDDPDSASDTANEVLTLLQKELDSTSSSEGKCIAACAILRGDERLLRAVGWDLLHVMMPFCDENRRAGSASEAAAATLVEASRLCNAKEILSMVLEGAYYFKTAGQRQVQLEMMVGIVQGLRANNRRGKVQAWVSRVLLFLRRALAAAAADAHADAGGGGGGGGSGGGGEGEEEEEGAVVAPQVKSSLLSPSSPAIVLRSCTTGWEVLRGVLAAVQSEVPV